MIKKLAALLDYATSDQVVSAAKASGLVAMSPEVMAGIVLWRRWRQRKEKKGRE